MKSIRVAVAAAVVGVALTACSSPMEAGAAAVVGSERISSRDLNKNVQEYEAALRKVNIEPSQLGVSVNQFVLSRMAEQSRQQQLADKFGVQVSDSEIDAAAQDKGEQQTAEMNLLSKAVSPANPRGYLRAALGVNKVLEKLGGPQNQQAVEKFKAAYNAIAPVFSPRYGTISQQGFVDAGRFGKPSATTEQAGQGEQQQQQQSQG
ncbi:SurA N-terminal domain-containing protein [Nonomuraea sp. NPDC049129]|uniref:SurA N-terminal domain-containing protein n=1 Tax=Nonomuraea sp. NPDC049129 TaxID=3155272 RepID=UPI0033FCF4B2